MTTKNPSAIELGRLGGEATKKKHSKEYYKNLALKKWAKKRKEKKYDK